MTAARIARRWQTHLDDGGTVYVAPGFVLVDRPGHRFEVHIARAGVRIVRRHLERWIEACGRFQVDVVDRILDATKALDAENAERYATLPSSVAAHRASLPAIFIMSDDGQVVEEWKSERPTWRQLRRGLLALR